MLFMVAKRITDRICCDSRSEWIVGNPEVIAVSVISGLRVQLTLWCKRVKLHHEPEDVHDDPRVLDPAVLKTIQHHPPYLYSPSSGRHTQEVASVRACPLEPSQDLVAFCNLLFDRKMQIGKRRPHTSQNVFQPFQAGALAWERNLFYDVLPDKLRDGVKFSKIDAFFNEAIDYGTVGVG
jgi:hypothetical protein